MKPNKNPSSIRLQDDIKTWLYQLAFTENRSLSNMVNKLLLDSKKQREMIEEYPKWRSKEEENTIQDKWEIKGQALMGVYNMSDKNNDTQ